MDNKSYGIGILTLTAVALLIANFFAPRQVVGIESVANSDMQAVTCHASQGGDALYLLDQGSGKGLRRAVDITTESYQVARKYMVRLGPADFADEPWVAKLAAAAGLDVAGFRAHFARLRG